MLVVPGDQPLELAPLVDLAAQAPRGGSVRGLRAPGGLALRVVDQALLDVEHRDVARIGRPLAVVRVDLARRPVVVIEDVEQDVVVGVDHAGRDDRLGVDDRRADRAGLIRARRAGGHAGDRRALDEDLALE